MLFTYARGSLVMNHTVLASIPVSVAILETEKMSFATKNSKRHFRGPKRFFYSDNVIWSSFYFNGSGVICYVKSCLYYYRPQNQDFAETVIENRFSDF